VTCSPSCRARTGCLRSLSNLEHVYLARRHTWPSTDLTGPKLRPLQTILEPWTADEGSMRNMTKCKFVNCEVYIKETSNTTSSQDDISWLVTRISLPQTSKHLYQLRLLLMIDEITSVGSPPSHMFYDKHKYWVCVFHL